MKKSSISWSILLFVFCLLVIHDIRSIAAVPFDIKPNWLTIIPALAIFVAFAAHLIGKKLAANKPLAGKGNLGAVQASAPVSALGC